MFIINFVRGFIMALADSVPGVSGGTIAFMMGFYDQFIGSLNTLISTSSVKEKKKAIIFLLKLGVGWICGFVGSVLILASIFDKEIYRVSSLFTGFILLSIPLIIKEEKEILTSNYKNIIFTIIGIAIVYFVSNPNYIPKGSINDLSSFSFGLALYVFIAGMIAISAMVLPGISGSTLLLIFGLYVPIINAIKEFLHLNFSYVPMLFVFGFGVLTGIATTIKVIRYLLEHNRCAIIYFILGLMIGSIYAVFMGPTTLDVPKDPMNFKTFNFIFFIIGGALILGLEKSKSLMESKQK